MRLGTCVWLECWNQRAFESRFYCELSSILVPDVIVWQLRNPVATVCAIACAARKWYFRLTSSQPKLNSLIRSCSKMFPTHFVVHNDLPNLFLKHRNGFRSILRDDDGECFRNHYNSANELRRAPLSSSSTPITLPKPARTLPLLHNEAITTMSYSTV